MALPNGCFLLSVKISDASHRDVTSICGFTREVLTAVIADIETAEWRRCNRVVPENPRASTTDDVECFFLCFEGSAWKVLHPQASEA